jgi:hypothetical protein
MRLTRLLAFYFYSCFYFTAWKERFGMNNGILNIVIALLLTTLILKVIMNIINQFGVDFVGFFQDLWRKIQHFRGE